MARMDTADQQRYLRAMGVDVYLPRARQASDPQATTQPRVQQPEPAYAPVPVLSEPAAAPAPVTAPQPVGSTLTPESASADVAVAAMDWGELAAKVKDCHDCGLRDGCTQTVFGVGPADARLLVVGEAPGADEDAQGEPFVGRAGKLLDEMLFAIGHARRPAQGQQGVYIANVVKCRPPKNRDPKPDEAAACKPYLERQIALLKPHAILAVGRIAAQLLMDTDQPIGKLRGTLQRYGDAAIPLVVTYHPAYLLRSPREKRKVWGDLCVLREQLEQVGQPA